LDVKINRKLDSSQFSDSDKLADLADQVNQLKSKSKSPSLASK